MARAKISEQPRARSKAAIAAAIDELSRGAAALKEFLSQVEDLGREGFPYIDAARARTELQFRECIRRTFGEKSSEFQAHRHHRLLMGSPDETRQSVAVIKSLIATLDQRKLELQGGPPFQQIPTVPLAPSMPVSPPLTLVPASISTVQVAIAQTVPIAPPPVAVTMTTNLGVAPVSVVPSSLPAPPLPLAPSHKPEPPISAPHDSVPLRTPPAPIATAIPPTPPKPAAPVALEPQPAKTDVSQASLPQQPLQPEPEPIVHPISPPKQQPRIQYEPLPSTLIGSSSSRQEPTSQPTQTESTPVERVRTLCCRFHSVARQLRLRGEYRATLSVEDETDVQDLLHALLRIQFDDIDTEEWTPSYAEGAPRTTFLLNDNQLAVLVKKTRNGLTAKDLTEQIRIDAERYLTKSRCTSLLCFIYDPDGRIGNPRAFETTLTTVNGSLTIDVLIAPK